MDAPAQKPELRNEETIRAYLEELVRLKVPVQIWKGEFDETPFETTLEQVTATTFSTTTTPLLETDQVLNFSFMLDKRRFVTHAKVVSTGTFTFPLSVIQGERRAQARGTFDRSDRAEVVAVERVAGVLLGGRTILGKLMDLSHHGLRVLIEEQGALTGPGEPLKRGDTLGLVCIGNLPYLRPIHCAGTIAHVTQTELGTFAGLLLNGLSEEDEKNLERILVRRFPATFGQAFPDKKRKIDIADQAGAPTKTQVKAKAPEVVERSLERVEPPPRIVERPTVTTVMRLRKPGKKILFLSTHPYTQGLAEAFRADGFKQVFEAKSFLETKNLVNKMRLDLLILDTNVGGHWGKDMMKALHSYNLLMDTPTILVVDSRNAATIAFADSLGALYIHERRETYDDLVPVIYRLLLDRPV